MRKILFPLLLLLLLSACSQQTAQIHRTTVPANTGVDAEYDAAFLNANEAQLLFKEDQSVASFIGIGNEYASFTETTHWLSSHYIAVTIDHGGTSIHRYFYINNNKVYFIKEVTDAPPLTLEQLKVLAIGKPLVTTPFIIGASVDGWQVSATGATVSTPYQEFTNVIVLEKTTINETNKMYIAPGFGMIRNEFTVKFEGQEEQIISTLADITYEQSTTPD